MNKELKIHQKKEKNIYIYIERERERVFIFCVGKLWKERIEKFYNK